MPRKTIKSVDKIDTKLGLVNFQLEYLDGTKEQFSCSGEILQNLVLSAIGQPNFALPPGDAPLQCRVLRADATGDVAIQLVYPGNKNITLAFSPQTAKQLGEQLLSATSPRAH